LKKKSLSWGENSTHAGLTALFAMLFVMMQLRFLTVSFGTTYKAMRFCIMQITTKKQMLYKWNKPKSSIQSMSGFLPF
jgi:hypothetical protein